MHFAVQSNSLSSTRKIGQCLGELLEPGDVLLLSGDLGAGKTTLTKAVASTLGIDEREVTSPSFALIHEHPFGRIPLVHVDLYRLGPHADLEELGIEEYLDGGHVLVIEWAEHLGDKASGNILGIDIGYEDEKTRRLEFSSDSERWKSRLAALRDCVIGHRNAQAEVKG